LHYSCNNNLISGNFISYALRGIVLEESLNNIIENNYVFDNTLYGIIIVVTSNNNLLDHNNLMNNGENTFDECVNQWYTTIINEGNYYDDYTGTDPDGDGIGNTPYNIPGGSNKDLYPLMNPIWNNTNK